MKALLIVDMQNDFMPGGALAVKGADEIIPFINSLMKEFDLVIATKDWHPKGHCSFTKWPEHCVQKSVGSDFPKNLDSSRIHYVVYKGEALTIDSYSGFFDDEHKKETTLRAFLQKNQVDELFVVGVAIEYCVQATVLDALNLGFSTTVIVEGCRGLELHPGDSARAFAKMAAQGALLVRT